MGRYIYSKMFLTEKYKNEMISKLVKVFEIFYFIVFSVFLYTGFVATTMRIVDWPDNLHENIQNVLWWVVGIKFFLNLINGDIDLKRTIFIIIALISGIMCFNLTKGYDIVLDVMVLIIGAINIDYKNIVKLYLIVSILVTIHVIIQSKSGEVVDLIYYRGSHIRDSFGFVYPTDFAAHIFFIVCAWIVFRQEKCTYLELFFFLVLAVLLQYYCQARCSVLSIMLLIIFMIICKNINKIVLFDTSNRHNRLYKCILFSSIPLILASLILILGNTKVDNSFISFLDKLLSTRVRLTREAFLKYNVKPWGQYVYMNGNGGSIVEPENYFYIDSSYVNILIRYGLFVFLVVLVGIVSIITKNINNYFILLVLIVICIHSVIEHHLFEYYYNFFIILPLANFNPKKKQKLIYQIKDSEFVI